MIALFQHKNFLREHQSIPMPLPLSGRQMISAAPVLRRRIPCRHVSLTPVSMS